MDGRDRQHHDNQESDRDHQPHEFMNIYDDDDDHDHDEDDDINEVDLYFEEEEEEEFEFDDDDEEEEDYDEDNFLYDEEEEDFDFDEPMEGFFGDDDVFGDGFQDEEMLDVPVAAPVVPVEEEDDPSIRVSERGRQREASNVGEDVKGEEREGECSGSSEWETNEIDGLLCPICMEPWAQAGDHLICCLPCGHVYGLSCIKRWLQQLGSISGKCPQCKKMFQLDHVRRLYASRLLAVDEMLRKKLLYLETRCAHLEKKEKLWCKREKAWLEKEKDLHDQNSILTAELTKEKLRELPDRMEQSRGSVTWERDVYAQVMRGGKYGQIRGLGLGPTSSRLWDASSSHRVDSEPSNVEKDRDHRLQEIEKELKTMMKRQLALESLVHSCMGRSNTGQAIGMRTNGTSDAQFQDVSSAQNVEEGSY
ncbi:Zinc finger, RING-type [Dillenia turbinata]|uniref:Zinc finger, RING-type n=1 Tax=Dillenia turbinata TaxID=194707 RepID=A0AAN8YUE9_9MAGN